jgi:hypothetical protein
MGDGVAYESLYEGGPFHGKIRFVAERAFHKGHIHIIDGSNDGIYRKVGRIENGLFLWRYYRCS